MGGDLGGNFLSISKHKSPKMSRPGAVPSGKRSSGWSIAAKSFILQQHSYIQTNQKKKLKNLKLGLQLRD